MKKQLKVELHGKSVGELTKQLRDAQSASRDLKLNHEQGKVKNTSQLARKRAEIAVIKTIMNEKIAAAKVIAEDKKVVEKPLDKKSISKPKGKGGKNE